MHKIARTLQASLLARSIPPVHACMIAHCGNCLPILAQPPRDPRSVCRLGTHRTGQVFFEYRSSDEGGLNLDIRLRRNLQSVNLLVGWRLTYLRAPDQPTDERSQSPLGAPLPRAFVLFELRARRTNTRLAWISRLSAVGWCCTRAGCS